MAQQAMLNLGTDTEVLGSFKPGDQVVLEVIGVVTDERTVTVEFLEVKEAKSYSDAAKRAYVKLGIEQNVG